MGSGQGVGLSLEPPNRRRAIRGTATGEMTDARNQDSISGPRQRGYVASCASHRGDAQPAPSTRGTQSVGPGAGRCELPGAAHGHSRGSWCYAVRADVHRSAQTRAQIDVYENAGSGTGDWILQILGVNAGVPVNGVLASATIPASNVPTGSSTASAGFAPAPPVTAGQQYALVVTRPAATLVGVQVRGDDPCPGGEFYSSGGPPPSLFTPGATPQDHIFAVFVTPPHVPASTPPADTGQRAAALKRCKKKAKKHDWSKKRLKKCKRSAMRLPV
jgi:hypothetical protein